MEYQCVSDWYNTKTIVTKLGANEKNDGKHGNKESSRVQANIRTILDKYIIAVHVARASVG